MNFSYLEYFYYFYEFIFCILYQIYIWESFFYKSVNRYLYIYSVIVAMIIKAWFSLERKQTQD